MDKERKFMERKDYTRLWFLGGKEPIHKLLEYSRKILDAGESSQHGWFKLAGVLTGSVKKMIEKI